ncbi:MAG: type V CRISPR-associated protein Cas12b [Limisphaerales bacterium]
MALKDPRLRRLRYGERDNSFEQVLFRYIWLRNDARLCDIVRLDLRAYVENEKPEPAPRDQSGNSVDNIPFRRFARIAFPLFGKLCLVPDCKERSPWWDFDCQAFQVAAEDLFKYKLRTLKREQDFGKKKRVIQAYLGVCSGGLTKEESPSGRPMPVRGMSGDGRLELMKRALDELAVEFGFESYGLRPATIGGWTELRKHFRNLEEQAAKHCWPEAALAAKLDDAVDEQQEKNRDGFGSEAFFRKLTEVDFHDLWRAKPKCELPPEPVNDFVHHYTLYSLLVEEMDVVAQKDATGGWVLNPIRFTWPGTQNPRGKTSLRHFDFRAALNQKLKVTLFLKHDGKKGGPRHEKLEDQQITLSARRLKRDRVMTKEGDSTDALWSPPLVLDAQPPRAGKPRKSAKDKKQDQEVSFSLIVSDAPSGKTPPPVFFKVAIPIEQNEYKKLSQGCITWGSGSLRGHKDGDAKRTYFRWPADLATEGRTEDAGPELGNEAKIDERKKKSKFSPSSLWCGDGKKPVGHFRVKGRNAEEGPTEFHALSVDLGVRFAAACSRLRVFIAEESERQRPAFARARLLAPDGYPTDIRALPYRMQTLRLPGEGAHSWQRQDDGIYALLPEEFGSRGRFPLVNPEKGIDETETFRHLADAITPLAGFALPGTDKLTVPEMGDHLVRRLRRRLSRIKTLYNMRWRVSGKFERNPDKPIPEYDKPRTPEQQHAHRLAVVQMLARAAFPSRLHDDEVEHPANKSLRDALHADAAAWEIFRMQTGEKPASDEEAASRQRVEKFVENANWTALGSAIQRQLDDLLGTRPPNSSETANLLSNVANFCLPLRGRLWSWQGHVLSFPEKETHPAHKPHIRGMRGLAMRRLEQITDLRQCCQSLAKLEERYDRGKDPGIPGVEPYIVQRGEKLGDDPCLQLLEKRNDQREERVNQIAHMILAEALGLELEDPSKVRWEGLSKKEAKSVCDLHGRYRHVRDEDGKELVRCDVIILEDLSRYRTSQDRPRRENSQLMHWSHRAVVTKLCDIARPFGITIILVDAAYSSRFHCASGLPGVRVNEVSRGFHEDMPYAAWAKETKKKGGATDRAQAVKDVKDLFDKNERYGGTLIIAAEGGKEFLSVAHPQERGTFRDALINADINAAVSIGLRALAHPDRFDIFPRIQTETLADGKLRARNRRGTLAMADAKEDVRVFSPAKPPRTQERPLEKEDASGDEEDTLETTSRPNLFVDAHNAVAPRDDRYSNAIEGSLHVNAARGPIFWARARQICKERIAAENAARVTERQEPNQRKRLD